MLGRQAPQCSELFGTVLEPSDLPTFLFHQWAPGETRGGRGRGFAYASIPR